MGGENHYCLQGFIVIFCLLVWFVHLHFFFGVFGCIKDKYFSSDLKKKTTISNPLMPEIGRLLHNF